LSCSASEPSRVEVDRLAPLALAQARCLFRLHLGAGRDHQEVVAERAPAGQFHLITIGLDHVDGRHDQLDIGWDEALLGLHDISLAVAAERNKQEAGLIVVHRVLIHHRDLPLAAVEHPIQPGGDHCAGGSGAEN
jgi:hypothetical protein